MSEAPHVQLQAQVPPQHRQQHVLTVAVGRRHRRICSHQQLCCACHASCHAWEHLDVHPFGWCIRLAGGDMKSAPVPPRISMAVWKPSSGLAGCVVGEAAGLDASTAHGSEACTISMQLPAVLVSAVNRPGRSRPGAIEMLVELTSQPVSSAPHMSATSCSPAACCGRRPGLLRPARMRSICTRVPVIAACMISINGAQVQRAYCTVEQRKAQDERRHELHAGDGHTHQRSSIAQDLATALQLAACTSCGI